jgi:hypothetical protein
MMMDRLYSDKRGHLTTDHAASSYGTPVLVMEGEAYGSADVLPFWPQLPMTAAEYVY